MDAVDCLSVIKHLNTLSTSTDNIYYQMVKTYMSPQLWQGFVNSADANTRRYDEFIKSILHKAKIVKDTLLYDIENAFFHVWDYLTLCTKNGIVIN